MLDNNEIGNINADQQLAASIIEGRHVAKTRVQYKRKIDKFKAWISGKYPECINANDDSLRYTGENCLKDDHYTEFFANVSKKAPAGPNSKRKRKGDFQSFEHVSGYRSAIIADAKHQKITLESSITNEISKKNSTTLFFT
jgi:hypothetical protein